MTPFLLDFSFLREKYYSLEFYLPVNYITSKKRVKKKRENRGFILELFYIMIY
ncbi:hypothetical protein HMPREF0851_01774 [Streptococcus sp. M334]|nr:hypothetical protein HMPREF0851_01774 [Streptococcus sp. M334]